MGYPLDLIWLAVPAYIILQCVVLCWRSSDTSQWVAALPLVFMVPVFILTVVGFLQGSNLWPLLLIFASPVALLYVVFLGLVKLATGKKSNPATQSERPSAE